MTVLFHTITYTIHIAIYFYLNYYHYYYNSVLMSGIETRV